MKTLSYVLALVSLGLMAAACSTTDKNAKGGAGGKEPGVTIEGKIDDGKGSGGSGSGSGSASGSGAGSGAASGSGAKPGTGSANTGGTASGQDGALVPGTAPNAAASGCYKGDPEICKIEAEILRLTNEERKKGGLFGGSKPPLRAAPKLSWVARDWSQVQARRGSIGHDGFPNQRQRLFNQEFAGERAEIAAENVAMTGYGQDVAKEFFEMWRSSPGHYANMMGDYAVMGIGVAHDGDGWYATEIFGDE